MSTIQYRFDSQESYNNIIFNESLISVKDFKQVLLTFNRNISMVNFQLQITDAKTKRVYTNDESFIPKNSSLIISKIPLDSQPKKVCTNETDVKTSVSAQSTPRRSSGIIFQQPAGVEDDAALNQYKAKASVNNPSLVSFEPTVNMTDVKTSVSARSTPRRSSGIIYQQPAGVEKAVLNQYKAKLNSPVTGTIASVNNPCSGSSEPIVDVFTPAPSTQIPAKAPDDLFQSSTRSADKLSAPMIRSSRTSKQDPTLHIQCMDQIIKMPSSRFHTITDKLLTNELNKCKAEDFLQTFKSRRMSNIKYWEEQYSNLESEALVAQKNTKELEKELKKNKRAQPPKNLLYSVNINVKITKESETSNSMEKKLTVIEILDDDLDKPLKVSQSTNTVPVQVNQEMISPVIDSDYSLENPHKAKRFKPGPKSKTKFVDTKNCSHNDNKCNSGPKIKELNYGGSGKLNTVVIADENIKRERMSKPINESKSVSPPKTKSPEKPMRNNNISMESKYPPPFPDEPKQKSHPFWKELPEAPVLTISTDENKVKLSWTLKLNLTIAEIKLYELFGCQETKAAPVSSMWKKISDLKAKRLPMEYEVLNYNKGNNYYFALRAIDVYGRRGPITIEKSRL